MDLVFAEGRAEATPLHKTFSLSDVYAHENTLAKLHPANRHVRDKIRQQLQVLRDMGLTVPLHKEIAFGTLRRVLRDASITVVQLFSLL